MKSKHATARPAVPRADHLRLSYLYGGAVVYQPGEELAPRVLTDFEFVLMHEGVARYRVDGREHTLPPGSVVLARPGFHETYLWDCKRHTRHAYFHFGIEALPRDWPAPAGWPVVRRNPDPALAGLFHAILERIHRHPDWPSRRPPRSDARLVEALIELFLRGEAGPAAALERERPEPVRRALKWMREIIDQQPERRIPLADMARAAGVSAKHLCRVFTRAIGHSPLATYRLLRLQLAVALLARSNLSVKEIAQRCGFDDALYFSRCFAAAFGHSPRATRHRLRSGRPPPPIPLPPDLMPRLYW